MSNLTSKTSVQWLFKMAWRDGKASISRLMLFMASIILGIAAVVSIQLFSENLKQNIKNQSKALMGADFIIDSRQLPSEKVQLIIDSLNTLEFEFNVLFEFFLLFKFKFLLSKYVLKLLSEYLLCIL